jgi:site-specific DNA-methyltransferase (adenine-specific)
MSATTAKKGKKSGDKGKKRRRIVKPASEQEVERLRNLHQEERVELVDPKSLRPHPRNEAIYADEPDKDLLQDIEKRGIRQALICNRNTKTVISGRRRHKAALLFNFPAVPVIWREFEDDQDELEAIVMHNAYRKKNERQVILEVEAIWSIEQGRSLALQAQGSKNALERKKELEEAQKEAEQNGVNFIARKAAPKKGRRTEEVVGQALGQPKTKVSRAASLIKAAKERLGDDWQQDELVQAVFTSQMSINSAALKMQRDRKEEAISEAASDIQEVDADIRHQDNILDIADQSIDHIITDPSYDVPTGYGSMVHDDDGICDVFEDWNSDLLLDELSGWAHEWARVLKTGGNIAVFCDERYLSFLRDALLSNGFMQINTVAWHRTNPNSNAKRTSFLDSMTYIVTACMSEDHRNAFRWLGIKRMHNFIEGSDALGRGGLKHLGQLPDYVVEWLVERLTNPGDTVLDNFAGTGTTGVVCAKLKRNFTLVERDEKCIKAIKVRLASVR